MKPQNIYIWTVRLALFASVLYACTQVVSVCGGGKQHDFRTYYYAAKAYQYGMNPYDIDSLRQMSRIDDLKLPYVYPPHCLSLFLPFTFLEYTPAYFVFFTLKLAALLVLVGIWIKIVPVNRNDLWAFFVTILIGYRCTIFRDIRSGNVSILEQLLIWSGILFSIRNRSVWGCFSIALSSVFKLIPVTLTPLVVIIRRTWRSFGIAIFTIFTTISTYVILYASRQQLWKDFISAAGTLDERGNSNPSSLALLRDLADFIGFNAVHVYVLYVFICGIVLVILTWAFVTTRNSRDVYPMMYLTIIGYALLAPRLKDYSLILLLLPTLHILGSMARTRWQAIVGTVFLWVPMIDYQSLILAAFVFALNLKWIWDFRKSPTKRIELTLNPLNAFIETHSKRIPCK